MIGTRSYSIGLFFTLLILAIMLGQVQNSARNSGTEDAATRIFRSLLLPPGDGLYGRIESLNDRFTNWRRGPEIMARIRELEEQIASLRQAEAESQRLALEQERLRQLIDLPGLGKEKVYAQVVAYWPFENRIVISVGSADGIEERMPVISASGLVGVVETVSENRSDVLLLSSPVFQIGALVVGDPGIPGLLRGDSYNTLILEIWESAVIEVGDEVVTSGFSEMIPRGIPIGTVIESVRDPEFGQRTAFVYPEAQMGRLSVVAVLK